MTWRRVARASACTAVLAWSSVGWAGPLSGTFFDDFTATSLGSSWVAMNRHGDYSNSELQCYSPSNVGLTGGNLVLTTQVQSLTCGDATHAATAWNYSSGMVQWSTLNFTYGTVEFRAKFAGGQGTWPAVWLLGANCQTSNVTTADNIGTCNWPNPGSDEIDIAEVLPSDHLHVNQQIHSGNNNSGCSAAVSDVSQNWHVYQLVWSAGSLVWLIDGVQTCQFTTGIPSTPMFVLVNTALGGAGGLVSDSTLPQTTSVDYVKVTTSGSQATPALGRRGPWPLALLLALAGLGVLARRRSVARHA
jgi:beta-glucanase (GH16 family)